MNNHETTDEAGSGETDQGHGDGDWLLSMFVGFANKGTPFDPGLSVWTGGVIVSGTLAGVSEYFEGIAEDFDAATHGDELGDVFRKMAEEGRQQINEADEAGNLPTPRYVHLKDARTYAPGGSPIPTNRGVWWRGRLDAVDAWCFGELRAE
jgi:hypothetical protein